MCPDPNPDHLTGTYAFRPAYLGSRLTPDILSIVLDALDGAVWTTARRYC
jgi:hypothetical protein